MHDINYFIRIKDEINEYINKNTIVKLNELFFKLDKNLDIMNIIVLNLLTKSDKSQFYYNNLFTKINENSDDIDKNYYNFSYYLYFSLNQNGDFDLEIKDSEGRVLSKENLETINNSLSEGENYD